MAKSNLGEHLPPLPASAVSRQPLVISTKTKEQARDTILYDGRGERGFLSRKSCAVITVLGSVSAFVSPVPAAFATVLLLADYVTFVIRRRQMLQYYERGTPRLSTPADFEELSAAWAREGKTEPSMSDWNEAAGYSEVESWRESLRYRIAASYYTGGTLLDVGCGDGRFCWKYGACEPSNYIGLDISPDLLRELSNRTGQRARTLLSVAEDLQLSSESVDCVVCGECFEHLPDPGKALQEFARVLKPGGRIIIQTPNAMRLRNTNPFHVLSLVIGYWVPGVLLRKVVHEHTFSSAFTYHWDFTRQDFNRYISGCPRVSLEEIHGATYRFNPDGSLLHRVLAGVFRLPVIHWLGWDLTVVLKMSR
jgi:ubiquinone/menaquinone biosynthesis C-methylase UbiE